MAARTQVKREKREQPSYNVEMRTNKLHKLAARAHAWRVQVWAQQAMRIEEINEQLAEMGQPPVDLFPFDPQDGSKFAEFAKVDIPPK